MFYASIDNVSLLDENFRKLLPTLRQVDATALGLVRLQTTYELTTKELANGKTLASSSFPSYHQMTSINLFLI